MTHTDPSKTGFLIDMDGLLINSETIAHNVFKELCKTYGGTFTHELHSRILGSEDSQWSTFIQKECNLSVTAEKLKTLFYQEFEKRLDADIALMPGAAELLAWIEDNNYSKCLVTSSNTSITNRNLQNLDLDNYFDQKVTAEISPKGKPEPDPYLYGASLIEKEPKDCIVIEDSYNGVMSGYRAGCTVIAVPTEFAEKSAYTKADYIFESLHDVVASLKR